MCIADAVNMMSDNTVDDIKIVAGNGLKSIGMTILEGVPAIMSALDTLTKIHPFLEGGVLPRNHLYNLICHVQPHIFLSRLSIASRSSSEYLYAGQLLKSTKGNHTPR